jgi:hypothetical protein
MLSELLGVVRLGTAFEDHATLLQQQPEAAYPAVQPVSNPRFHLAELLCSRQQTLGISGLAAHGFISIA